MKEMKIYTKTGDKGHTSLLGGMRVPKYHLKIEAYGTADELNAFIGLLCDQDISSHHKGVLRTIQDRVFTAESIIASDKVSEEYSLPSLSEADVTLLENEIDNMNSCLPHLANFILPGGHPAVSLAHICRVVCRRAERLIIRLAEDSELDDLIIVYFNRLSDYFFVLARKIAHERGVEDLVWKPGKSEE